MGLDEGAADEEVDVDDMMTGLDCATPEDVELVAAVSVVVPAVVVGATEEDGGAPVEAGGIRKMKSDLNHLMLGLG